MARESEGIARVRDVSVRADSGAVLLRDVTFALSLPGRVAVMGRNGSGKSVLASALAGALAHEGLVEVPAPRAAVLQSAGTAFVAHSVREEIAFALACHETRSLASAARVEDALDRLDLVHLADRDPATLSGGERQRVHLAAALVVSPGTLILDEPTEYLDARHAAEIRGALSRARVPLVIHATHESADALEADLLIVLDRGAVAAAGPPAEVLRSVDLPALGLETPPALMIARALAARGVLEPPLPVDLDELERRLDATR